MKLLTEMSGAKLLAGGHEADEDCCEWYQVNQLEHDAAAAHALLQAMREAGDGSADVAFYSDDDYQNWVYDRCDALLKQWGFDTGEGA